MAEVRAVPKFADEPEPCGFESASDRSSVGAGYYGEICVCGGTRYAGVNAHRHTANQRIGYAESVQHACRIEQRGDFVGPLVRRLSFPTMRADQHPIARCCGRNAL
jgi:hypothetical protein